MRVSVHALNLPASDALVDHAQSRFGSALGRFDDRIERVIIRLEDDNGPKGGPDKLCRVDVHVAPKTNLVLEERDADLYTAITRAAKRAKIAMTRKFSRKRGMLFSRPRIERA